ncbi:MAG TPA: phage tail protein [Roseiarcus sp.]|nr:phage tail protein [Roseiarcus sp.]
MAFFRSNRKNPKPDYTSLQLNTATTTLPIPILWGRQKIAGNVIWYQNFVAYPQKASGKGGGKGGGGGTVTGYDYRADVIIALCEGPCAPFPNGVGFVWHNQTVCTLAYLGLGYQPGMTPQPAFSWLPAAQSLSYPGTTMVGCPQFDLGESATIGNINFEVYGIFQGTGVNGIDADPALVINDFLTNPQYGAGFDPASISAASLFGSGGDGSLQTYCKAMGIAFSPVLSSQEQASSVLTRWLKILNCAAVWSGGLLKFIPYGDSAIAAGSITTLTEQFSIPTPVPVSTGNVLNAYVTVAGAAQFAGDGGVVYASTGLPLTFTSGAVNAAGLYGMSPAGTYIFAPQDEGKPVIITYTLAAATSYAPNLTPVYALGDNDFVDEKGNKDPLQVERADVFSLPTIQRVEVCSRSNRYSPQPVEARDQSQIEMYGPRVASVVQAHEICDEHSIGPIVAQMILQRDLYVRTRFTFKLSWEFCLLDPMDIVTLTDAGLGLSNYPVRVTEIEEDDNGLLAVTAEELVFGVSTPAANPSASASNYSQDQGVPAVPVNAPLVYEPPPGLTNGVQQIWLGASPVATGTTQQWGGAYVWVSLDNSSFSQMAIVQAPLRQGFLTASLPAATGWDAANTLAVDLTESATLFQGSGNPMLEGTASQTAAQQGATMSLVDAELLAYETVTQTSAAHYSLTGLARALGGTNGAPHSTSAPFARLDSAVVMTDLPANFIGKTLYFKFQSFNAFGGGVQDITTCTVYSYTPTGNPSGGGGPGSTHPIASQLASGFALDLGSVNAAPSLSDDFGVAVAGNVTGSVDLGAVSVVSHPIMAAIMTGANQDMGLVTGAISVSDDFGSVVDAVVDSYNLGTVP